MTDRLHVLIEGFVQGVGFRFSTVREAQKLELCGWVRNCPDGRVEAEFEGPRPALDKMLQWCRRGPAFSRVANVTPTWDSGTPRYANFSIRF
ncbi:MAG TPA: acylphosphatase [Candidatus Hydrogenedentes bacterium]|nr:acylphosphatase [Candidatus Hydrogenedentota bacterium]HIJ73820.1 acylphosphatase [Candidatus Hydrogenedentota bacterium]